MFNHHQKRKERVLHTKVCGIRASACYFQQFDILTSVDSDEPVQPPLSLETPNGVQSVAKHS